MKKLLNRKNKKGFTIVELVIVIGVIGILSAILIPTFTNLTSQAQVAAKQNDLSTVYTQYVADASDGYYGDPKASGAQAADKVYPAGQVYLVAGGKYYYFDTTKNVWNVTPLDSAAEGSAQLGTETYSGYTVYRIGPANA